MKLLKGESRRKNGTYAYRYTFLGKRYCIYAKTIKELREKERNINYSSVGKNEITIDQMVDRWYATKFNLRPNTTHVYEHAIAYIKNQFNGVKLKSLRISDIKEWMIKLSKKDGLSLSYINSIKMILRNACEYAIEDELVDRNIFSFRMNFIPNNKQIRRALTDFETKRLLDYSLKEKHKEYYYITVFLLETGLRYGEFCGLIFNDIDMDNGLVDINKQLVRVTGYSTAYVGDLKTKNGYRKIPLTVSAKRCVEYFKANGNGINLVVNPQLYRNFLAKAKRKLGIPVSPHVLRHTFCTNLSNKGINLKSLQYLMGHSNISMTLNVYTDMTAQEAQKQMLKVL